MTEVIGRNLYREALTQVRENMELAITQGQSRITCLAEMMGEGLFTPVSANLAQYGLESAQVSEAAVDSDMTYEEAVLDGLRDDCPPEVLKQQALLEVFYWSFDGKIHKGQMVVDRSLVSEVEQVFATAFQAKFPISRVVPVSRYGWDDDASMNDDNTSAFNYRTIFGTDIMSRHARGRAIDINPLLNPHYRGDGTIVPKGAVYQAGEPGVLVEGDLVVAAFTNAGWIWGGKASEGWDISVFGHDYQHFEK